MKKALFKALKVEPGEWASVSLLLTISFFLGVFMVTFDVGVSTLFLDGPTGWGDEHLSRSFTLSGVLGVIVSYIFVTLQRKISFYRLVQYTFVCMLLYVMGLSYVLEATKDDTEWHQYLIYLAFASLGPLNALGLLSYYGVVTRSFNVKNQKRLTGTVDQGQMFATAIAFFAVPVIQTFPFFEDVIHFLFVSCIGLGVSLILFNTYFNKFRSNDLRAAIQVKKVSKASLTDMAKTPYIRLLAGLFMFSVLATYFVELSFLSVTADQYKYKGADELANFLAIYGGILTIFSLILQVFIGDKLMATYGVKISLLILPILLAAITTLSALVGTVMGYEVAAAGTHAIYFFIFMALSKFFLQSCKESFEEPIFKNFFLPVEPQIRHDVQAKIEGVFFQFSVIIAGVLLTALGALTFFELIHYSYFLVFIFIGYAYTSVKIHQEYQTTLKKTLAANQKVDAEKIEYSVAEALQGELESQEHERVIYALKLMEKMQPFKAESVLVSLSHDDNPEIRKYAIERIKQLKILAAIPSVKKVSEIEKSPLIKKLALDALENMDKTEGIAASEIKLAAMVKSRNPQEREYAAKLLGRSDNEESAIHLLLLMRDAHHGVRMSAILAAAHGKNPDLWPLLIEYLSSPTYGNAAAGVLASYGDQVIHTLETAFHRSGQNLQTQIKIVQIYGSIGGSKAINCLWDKIDYPMKKIRNQVLLSLNNCGFRVDNQKKAKVKEALETTIGNTAWNMAALSELSEEEAMMHMKEALEEEIREDHELIFLLLSFLYDAQSIRLVKENIQSGTVEGHLYGMELLDVFIDDDIHPILFPLLEETSQSDRNERLQHHFPRDTYDSTQVLLHIINRDYNNINRWTKACAIFGLAHTPGYIVTDDLIANLFNPDPLLRETAGWVIYHLDKDIYEACTLRLSPVIKKELDEKFLSGAAKKELRIERVVKLKQTEAFKNVPGVILADMEEIIETREYKQGEILIEQGENGSAPLFVVIKGRIGLYNHNTLVSVTEEKKLLGEMLLLETDINDFSAIALEPVSVLKIEKYKLFELMSNNYAFAKEYLRIAGARLPVKEISEVI